MPLQRRLPHALRLSPSGWAGETPCTAAALAAGLKVMPADMVQKSVLIVSVSTKPTPSGQSRFHLQRSRAGLLCVCMAVCCPGARPARPRRRGRRAEQHGRRRRAARRRGRGLRRRSAPAAAPSPPPASHRHERSRSRLQPINTDCPDQSRLQFCAGALQPLTALR